MKIRSNITEALTEARAQTSVQLKAVVVGHTGRVEGTKLDKARAQKLLKLYGLMDGGAQAKFDKAKLPAILKAYAQYL